MFRTFCDLILTFSLSLKYLHHLNGCYTSDEYTLFTKCCAVQRPRCRIFGAVGTWSRFAV